MKRTFKGFAFLKTHIFTLFRPYRSYRPSHLYLDCLSYFFFLLRRPSHFVRIDTDDTNEMDEIGLNVRKVFSIRSLSNVGVVSLQVSNAYCGFRIWDNTHS